VHLDVSAFSQCLDNPYPTINEVKLKCENDLALGHLEDTSSLTIYSWKIHIFGKILILVVD